MKQNFKPLFSFIILLIISLGGYSYFVYAAAPLGGYAPGTTLDPDCAPGDTDCIVALSGGSVTADNGLTATGNNVQLGGTLTQATTIDQNGNNYSLTETVPSTGGTLVFSQGLTTVIGFPGTVQGYVAPNGDATRNISWFNTGDGKMHTLSGSGDPSITRGGTEITTLYDPADTTSGIITLYAFDTPNSDTTQLQVSPTYINFEFDSNAEFRINGNAGSAGDVLVSNGVGIAPVWQVMPISVNGSTLYSSGLTGTGSTSGNNIFLGENAGSGATGTYSGNFFGPNAGNGATDAYYSNFFGSNAGYGAANASYSNFFGENAGNGATDAYYSNFFGSNAGYGAANASYSNFLGLNAGSSATNASSSNFLGFAAGYNAISANYSNFLGYQAGLGAVGASYSNFLGQNAGNSATYANYSNFFGQNAGSGATNASSSNFLGSGAGQYATYAYFSNFFGDGAGQIATNASYSNFFGSNAGYGATNAVQSNFIGDSAGRSATNANSSNFFGIATGYGANNASNSIFIGKSAGYYDTVDNTGSLNNFSILIGQSTSTGGYSNSIAIGGYATNTASNQFMIGSATRPIDEIRVVQTGGTECIIDTSGLGCTSDERLKTNITDLTTDTLDKLLNVKTVNYNWLNNPNGKTMTGFLAQDLEQYFPELVATNERGQKSVYYAQMSPILVEAIREMNIKITDIGNMETENTWRDALIAWLGNTANGITKIYADVFESKQIQTDQLCIKDVCMDRDQLYNLMNQVGSTGGGGITPDPVIIPDVPSENSPEIDPNSVPNTDPVVDSGTDNPEPSPTDQIP